MCHHIHRLRIRRRVTERLHDQIGIESQTRQSAQFVPSHGAGGILTSHRGHDRLAVLSRGDALHPTSLTDHLLGERKSTGLVSRIDGHVENVGDRGVTSEGNAGLGCEGSSNDQGDASPSADLVQENIGLQIELGHELIARGIDHLSLPGINVNDISGVEIAHVHFDGKRAGILHGIEKDGSDFPSDAHAARFEVGNVRNVLPHVMQHGVRGGFTTRSSPHHVSHVGQRVALLLQFLHLGERSDLAVNLGIDPFSGVLEHGQGVEGNVWTAPRVLGGRQIVRVRLAGDLENRHGNFVGNIRFGGVPLGIGPAFQDALGGGLGLGRSVGRVVNVHNVVEGIKD
mmetsp:Transcript_21168/g.44664  ORF Transcript_21168/g.44664 Transcript_21168/m.44664 type:complete len:342 (+) Transcript_21168:831-1856(+)